MERDACTGWWDGWPAWLGGTGTEWRQCCVAHDAAYGAGESFLAAHWHLFTCVGQVSWAMATVMLLGLLTLGSLYIVGLLNKAKRIVGSEDNTRGR